MTNFAIDLEACRARQRRFLDATSAFNADLLLVARRESVHWLTGAYVKAPYEPVAAVTPDGHVTLIVPERQLGEPAAADEVLGYEAKWHSTNRDDQRAASSSVLNAKLTSAPQRTACEMSTHCPHAFYRWDTTYVDIDPVIFQLRRCKDADELALLRHANRANQAMYERARQLAKPGANELDIYSELYKVAVQALGEPPTYFGQDFRSGARGGAPRDRRIEAGELFIFDLGVGFRGYHSDNARTISVDGRPSDLQQLAWQHCAAIFPLVESFVRPGASCRQLFTMVDELLNQHKPWKFDHHLGHGVGLAPQEGPHLNPFWDDTFAEGDFIAVEPGLYHEELRTGVRLEQNFLVTQGGVELLTNWALNL